MAGSQELALPQGSGPVLSLWFRSAMMARTSAFPVMFAKSATREEPRAEPNEKSQTQGVRAW